MIDSSSTATFHLPTEESTDKTVEAPGVLNGYVKNLENQQPVRQELSGRDIERAALSETEKHNFDLSEEESFDPNLYSDVKVESVTTAHETVAQPSLEDEREKIFHQVEAMAMQQQIQYISSHTVYIDAIRRQTLSRDDFTLAA